MPCPETKVSCGTTHPSASVASASPCENKLSCSGEVRAEREEIGQGKDEAEHICEKKDEDNSDPCKKARKCSAPVRIIEPQAELNDEPCPDLAATCQMARPDLSATTTRIDPSKPGCIDYEYCEKKSSDEEEFGCSTDFEDCNDYKEAEKKRKAEQKKRAKEKAKANKK